LVNDVQKKVDLSTFLSDGNILVRVLYRFLVFDCDGAFIDEVEFNHIAYESSKNTRLKQEYDYDISDEGDLNHSDDSDDRFKILRKGGRGSDYDVEDDKFEQWNRDPIFDFIGMPFDLADEDDDQKQITEINKMQLLQMSYDNTKFLFYNRMIGKIFVYEL
jgi:hypothetical protein